MFIEWPTPGLWPGVVGRKASTSSRLLLLPPFCNCLGLITSLFVNAFGNLMPFLKLLPSMGTSSNESNNISTKNKQVRVKCAIAKVIKKLS